MDSSDNVEKTLQDIWRSHSILYWELAIGNVYECLSTCDLRCWVKEVSLLQKIAENERQWLLVRCSCYRDWKCTVAHSCMWKTTVTMWRCHTDHCVGLACRRIRGTHCCRRHIRSVNEADFTEYQTFFCFKSTIRHLQYWLIGRAYCGLQSTGRQKKLTISKS